MFSISNYKVKVKKLLQRNTKPNLEAVKGKGKEVIDFDQMEDMEAERQ